MDSKRIIAGIAALLTAISASGMAMPSGAPLFKADAVNYQVEGYSWEYEKVSGGIKLLKVKSDYQFSEITIPSEYEGQKVVEVSAGILEDQSECGIVNIDDETIRFDGNILDHSRVYEIDLPDYSVCRYSQEANVWTIHYKQLYLDDFEEREKMYKENDWGKLIMTQEERNFREKYCELVDGKYQIKGKVDITVPATVCGVDVYELGSGFRNAEVVNKVTLPDTLHIIRDCCFMESTVTSVSIGKGIRFIPDRCFAECEELKEVKLPDDLIAVSDNAFRNTIFEKSASIPYGHDVTGNGAETLADSGDWRLFYNYTDDLRLIVTPVKYLGRDTVVDFPSEIDGLPVEENTCEISYSDYEEDNTGFSYYNYEFNREGILSDSDFVKEIRFPEDMDWLPLLRDSNIEKIDIPPGVTTIEINTFSGCRKLTSVTIPRAVKVIEPGAFQDCENLSEFIVESDSLWLGWDSLCGTAVRSLELPGNLMTGKGCFCDSVEDLTIRAGDKVELGVESLAGAKDLKKIVFSPDIREIYIGDSAFSNSGLEELELGSNVKDISHSAFKDCKELKHFKLRGNARIGYESFMNNESLESIELTGTPVIESKAFADCKALSNIVLDTASEIDVTAFNGCSSLYRLNGEEVLTADGTGFVPELDSFVRSAFDGAEGTGFIDKYIRNSLKKIVAETVSDDMSDLGKAKALHDWICANAEYAKDDLAARGNHTDSALLMDGVAVCEGYARLYNLLLNEAGVKSWFVTNSNHSWNVVMIDGKAFHIDTTWDDTHDSYDWFMRTDKEMKKSGEDHELWYADICSDWHSFQKDDLPVCDYFMGDLDGDDDLDTADLGELRERLINGAAYELRADLDFNGKAGAGDLAEAVIRLDSPGLRMGDVDRDGLITSADASLLLEEYSLMSVSSGKTFSERESLIADVNVDGQVNAVDASAILAYYTYISTGGTDNIAAYTENR